MFNLIVTAFLCASSSVRHCPDRPAQQPDAVGRDLLERDLLDEAVQVHATVGFCISVGRQRMVRTGSVVASAFRRIGAHEDTTCIFDLPGNICIIGRLDNQMLRSVQVGEVDHFLFILQHDKTAVAQRFFRDLLTGQPVQLFPDRLHDRFDDAFGCRHQHGLAVHSMFRLGKEICGDKGGIADSSAITSTSEGPAGMSMATSFRLTNCLAAVTYWLPGPNIL